MKMWQKILIAIGLGIVTGLVLGNGAEILKPVGDVFINLLKMLVVPLIFASMVMGISKSDTKRLGRVGLYALGFSAVSAVLTICLGIGAVSYLGLGSDLHLVATGAQNSAAPKIADLLVGIVPKNPIAAFAEGNVIQVIFFAILFGVSLNALGDFGKPVANFFDVLAHLMFRMAGIVMNLAPIGVFALMAWATGSFGLGVLLPVLKFLLCYTVAAILYAIVVYGIVLAGLTKFSPLRFLKGMTEPLTVAFSTCSSSATLPFTIRNAISRLGIRENFANFILPLGTSLNLNGSTLFLGMAAPFIAHAYGIDLSTQQLVIVGVMCIFATFSSATIPSGDLLMLTIVFASVGIPFEGIALLASVDRLRDMVCTTMNVTANTTAAMWLAKLDGALEETKDLDKVATVVVEGAVK
jgi:Na+/H+-dicarboxylate symporter